jgi:hypothetical protein
VHKELLVETYINDSADYDFIVDEATQNTLAPYFEFKDTHNIDVSYEKSYDKSGYGLVLKIHAVFINEDDLAIFRLRFGGDYPMTKHQEKPLKFVA